MAENRRVRLTKRLMKDALLELLESKPLEKIKVTDVCAAADVNRSTFYAYYSDVLGLLREIEDELIDGSPAMNSGSDYSEEKFLSELEEYFEFVRQNERLFRILLVRRSSDEFNRRLIDAVMERCSPVSSAAKGRYTYVFCESGVVGILRDWISDGFPVPSGDFAALVLKLCTSAAS